MGWREWLIRTIGPGLVVGMKFGDWMRLLRANGFRVRPRRWPKAACATLFSLTQTPLAFLEHVLYDHRIATASIHPPLFVLGHWRNGTTLLHNLLAVDPRFAYPRVFQVVAPHTFLLLEAISPIGSLLLPRTRLGVDKMALSAEVPAEDEAALSVMTLLSPVVGFAFPERADFYDRYLTFQDASPQETEQWKSALVSFVRKLTWRYKRPLVLKSPGHTCRIRLILDAFPDARFVHVQRNPYVVYQSMLRLMAAVWGIYSFQHPPEPAMVQARVLHQYRALYETFFAERDLIPAGRYCEVAFEQLEQDPLGELRRVYAELRLPDFDVAKPALEEYARSLVGYEKNVYPRLPAEDRMEIAHIWRRCFDEWGYPVGDG
jgi:omega-hydroxy-beta-dihydromenaquinone-9 sulfotransferase